MTVVPSAQEAELVCGMFQAHGIRCSYRATDIAAEAFGGWHEVLVRQADLDDARQLLADTSE